MSTEKPFPGWLRAELEARQMTQAELADLADLGTATINNILNGRRDAEISTYDKIAHALELPVDLVLEAAGLLPSTSKLSPIKRKLRNLVLSEELEESDLKLAIAILELRIDHNRKTSRVRSGQKQ